VWPASPPVGEGVDDQQAATALAAVGRLARQPRQWTRQAIADLDLEPDSVVVQEQLDGAAPVQDGVGHELAGEQLDDIKLPCWPRRGSGGNRTSGAYPATGC
jgi:hypothetical protein